MMPSARFAMLNYFRGGWHPLGFIGVGEAPKEAALKDLKFDSPAFDDSLHYKVPEKLLSVKAPPLPQVKAVTPWIPDPSIELINPWRYWTLDTRSENLEKRILTDGPNEGGPNSGDCGVAGALHRIRDQKHVYGGNHPAFRPATRCQRYLRPHRYPAQS